MDTLDRHPDELSIGELNDRLTIELKARTRMQVLSTKLVQVRAIDVLLEEILDAAIEITQADMGNLQLLVDGCLIITTQRGFDQEFLDYFQTVHDGLAACGTALQSGERVIVEDVANSAVFAGSKSREVMLRARALAVQSTPLVSRSGAVLGMFSTHYTRVRRPAEFDLMMLDVLARQASDLIEQKQAEERLQKQTARANLLSDAAGLILTASDPDSMLKGLFTKIGPHIGADLYFNFMMTEGGNIMRLASYAGIQAEAARNVETLELGQAICGMAALNRHAINLTSIQCSDDQKAQFVRAVGTKAYFCHPLIAGDVLLGTLSFGSRSKDAFANDEITFLSTICQYVTSAYERLRLVEQLRETDRRKDQFLATLAHELRNPLAPIKNAVTALGIGQVSSRWCRDVIERQVIHLTHLIDDLLDVSRITRDKLELRRYAIDLCSILDTVIETIGPVVLKHGHTLHLSIPKTKVWVNGDPVRLSQIFLNLLNNATRYTPDGGHIWVDLHTSDVEVTVSVRDDGIGIQPEVLPRMYEMFFQGDQSLEKEHGGLGIGLALVQKLVDLHGGDVSAHSDGEGRGATFIVKLPCVSSPDLEVSLPARDAGLALHIRKIIVVDDNQDSADTLAFMLQSLGHQVKTAYDGRSALHMIDDWRPELIILDIAMPKLNGYELCRRLRTLSWSSTVRIIALSGWGQDHDKYLAEQAGFDGHLTKPLDLTRLNDILK